MKSKISKILGVAVTIALLASLVVIAAASPVSAQPGALNYAAISSPSNVNNILVPGGPTEGVNFLASSANGAALFAFDTTATVGGGILYESTNMGATWSIPAVSAYPAGTFTGTGIALLVSPKFATDSTIVYVTTTGIYISANAGASFAAGPTPTLDGPISCAAIGTYFADGNVAVLIGTQATGAGTASTVQKFEIAAGSYAWTAFGGLAASGTVANGTGTATGSPITLVSGANTITTTVTGTLTNGTGVATGSPISLSLGANTITTTGAGTFTVTLPAGTTGTAATGTATVTGSPVALVAGANTVTTTSPSGTFTVTLTAVGFTFTVTLPTGVTGTATTGTAAVTASPVALVAGPNTVTTTSAGTFTVTTTDMNLGVFGVQFSPNHISDSEILTVADSVPHNGTGIPTLYSSFAGGNFAISNGCALSAADSSPATTTAVIAMGTDYNGLNSGNTVAVGINGATATSIDGIYQVAGRSSGAPGTPTNEATGLKVTSIAVTGPIGTATVLAGASGSPDVSGWTTFSGTPAAIATSKEPTGASFGSVIWTGTDVFASTTGPDSAVFESTDVGLNYNALGVVNVGTISAMSIQSLVLADANNMFVIMANGTGGTYAAQQLWVSTNAGTSWMRVLTSGGSIAKIAQVSPSPTFATDKTFFVSQGPTATSNLVDVTNTGGNSFSLTIASDKSTVIKAISNTTFYYGGASGTSFYKEGVFTGATFPTGSTGLVESIAINPMNANNIAVGMTVGTVYMSTDGGVTFTEVGSGPGAGTETMKVAFGPDGSLYALGTAVGSTCGIQRWVTSSASWLAIPVTTGALGSGTGLVITADGTLYASGSVADTAVWRSLYPTAVGSAGASAPQFQDLNDAQGFNGLVNTSDSITGLSVINSASMNTLYVVDNTYPLATSGYGFAGAILGFNDTLIGAPTLTSPKNGGNVTTAAYGNVAWTGLTGVTAYQVQSDDTSSAFTGNNMGIMSAISGTTPGTLGALGDCIAATSAIVGNSTSSGTGPGGTALTAGGTYYWEVRAVSTDPNTTANNIDSRWSTGWSFVTALPTVVGTATIPFSPLQGQQDVPVTTSFSWPAVSGATTYDFVIADSSVPGNTSAAPFTIIDYGDNTAINAYTPQTALKYDTTYFWEVRADSATAQGPWTINEFTTEPMPTSTTAVMTTPVVTPTVTVINSQPAVTPTVTVINSGTGTSSPVIPTYLLWLVIVVGAVLVIAVIVLIVRTRRIS
jgi:hypothetical protein